MDPAPTRGVRRILRCIATEIYLVPLVSARTLEPGGLASPPSIGMVSPSCHRDPLLWSCQAANSSMTCLEVACVQSQVIVFRDGAWYAPNTLTHEVLKGLIGEPFYEIAGGCI